MEWRGWWQVVVSLTETMCDAWRAGGGRALRSKGTPARTPARAGGSSAAAAAAVATPFGAEWAAIGGASLLAHAAPQAFSHSCDPGLRAGFGERSSSGGGEPAAEEGGSELSRLLACGAAGVEVDVPAWAPGARARAARHLIGIIHAIFVLSCMSCTRLCVLFYFIWTDLTLSLVSC
jgi:hypothetical protein